MPIATKLGRVVTYHEGLPPIKSHDPLITWSCKITWQTKFIITPLPKVAMTRKLGRMVTLTYLEGLLTIKSHNALITWSCKFTWQTKVIISTLRSSRLGKLVPHFDRLLPIKSYHPLIMWFCEITRQPKIIISPLSQCLWLPKLLGCWYTSLCS